jgi:ATP-binding cassette subfamily B protein
LAPRDHSVELRGISFRHTPAQPLLFDRFSLAVAAGTKLGLVGRSGGGKTTITRLLLRFKDVERGQILVGGQSIADVSQSSLREVIAYVPQDPAMFHRSIADNIRFARPEATDAEVEEVARSIGVDIVAARLEGGLQHAVREGGSGLSAGERQLISIARALLADPRILILDEATSNIDRPTERLIESALDRLLHGRTSLIIAHRVSTVRRADEILVLDHGRVVERGSYRQLMAMDGTFRRLAAELAGTVRGT